MKFLSLRNILKLKFCSSTSEHNKALLAMIIIKDVSCVPDRKLNLHRIAGKLHYVCFSSMEYIELFSKYLYA